ncbi:MAG TPA: Gfo/Idh/MocA family oxidoreductase [Candidatus Hydrogenedentes bacterium]|nr:Gfo/Idh/MocA family oxidoreductase [Candidatus Hydrogenedentota bacterium]HOS02615.1 Gfo/Idh/MocA family oxidoreductase [Candidatus Hydrogenedentota bacterium]
MSEKKVRIGFVGVGGMGQCAHLKNYATLPECEVTAIAEYRQGMAHAVAKKYNVPRVYPDHEAMLATEELDGIVASQQFVRHAVLLPDLLKANVPLFTEKPLAGCIEAGQTILDALAASTTWHMVGYHKRSDPATMYAKTRIEALKQSGELGKLKYVRILMPAGDWVANGFTDLIGSDDPMPEQTYEKHPTDMDTKTYEEYIAFVNYYIHQVNLMRHVLGEDYTLAYVDKNNVLLVVETPSGVTGTIEMSPYTTSIAWEEEILVAFEHGYIKLELPAPLASNRCGRVEMLRDPGNGVTPETTVPTLPWVHAMRQQAINFIEAIQGKRPPMCTAQEAMKDLIVARDYIRLRLGK